MSLLKDNLPWMITGSALGLLVASNLDMILPSDPVAPLAPVATPQAHPADALSATVQAALASATPAPASDALSSTASQLAMIITEGPADPAVAEVARDVPLNALPLTEPVDNYSGPANAVLAVLQEVVAEEEDALADGSTAAMLAALVTEDPTLGPDPELVEETPKPDPIASLRPKAAPRPEAEPVALATAAPLIGAETVVDATAPDPVETSEIAGSDPGEPTPPLDETAVAEAPQAVPAIAPQEIDLVATAVAMLQQTPAAPPVSAPVSVPVAPPALTTTPETCAADLKALAEQARIYFPDGGLTSTDTGLSQARLIGRIAPDCPGYTVEVAGYSGSEESQDLSQKRAEAVVARLAGSGIDISNFVAVGHGARPLPPGFTAPEGYDNRRVEFKIVPVPETARFVTPARADVAMSQDAACVAQLQYRLQRTRIFFGPGDTGATERDMDQVLKLAAEVSGCEGVRLRIVGHHADTGDTPETVATGRLRALAVMRTLVASGFASDRFLISAPSWSATIPGQPGLPNSRVDFQLVLTEG